MPNLLIEKDPLPNIPSAATLEHRNIPAGNQAASPINAEIPSLITNVAQLNQQTGLAARDVTSVESDDEFEDFNFDLGQADLWKV